MYTDFIIQSQVDQQERELVRRLERRRVAAERAVQEHGGERLAVIAHLAREGRRSRRATRTAPQAPRPVAPRPAAG